MDSNTIHNVALLCELTNVNIEQAKVLLEMCNGNVENAAGYFFENGVPEAHPEQRQPVVRPQQPVQQPVVQPTHDRDNEGGGDGNVDVDDFMKRAVEQGAKSIGEVGAQEKEHYVGTAHKVGEVGKSSQKVVFESKQDKRRIITFYKSIISISQKIDLNCFTLDEGPPRKYEDPANKEFLDSIREGIYPAEIRPVHGQEIDVELIDKKGEDWKPSPKDIKAFDGPVQSMNSGNNSQNASYATAKAIVVDSSKPSGSIKVKFLDGTSAVVKANKDNTIGDLKNHIESLKPCKKAFVISIQETGQPLTELGKDLNTAGVIGKLVVQTLV